MTNKKDEPKKKKATDNQAGLAATSRHKYSLNCPPIEIPLAAGGMDSGKIITIPAERSSGKTTIALFFCFCFCDYWIKLGRKFRIKWIETESSIDIDRVIFQRPDLADYFDVDEAETHEEAHMIMRDFLTECLENGEAPFIVWDTLAAATTLAQKKEGKRYAGGQQEEARILRHTMRDITNLIGKSDGCLVLPNQTYESQDRYGNKKLICYGGGAIQFHSSVIMNLQVLKSIMIDLKDGREISQGILVECFTDKNKLTSPKQTFHIVINNEEGVDVMETRIQYLISTGLAKNGPWKTFKFPERAFDKEKPKEVPAMVEMKWQNQGGKRLKGLTETKYSHLTDYVDYLIYDSYAKVSPLMKLKIIEKLWEYETQFLGEPKTPLTEREILVAEKMEEMRKKQLKKEEEKLKEEHKIDVESDSNSGKKTTKKKTTKKKTTKKKA